MLWRCKMLLTLCLDRERRRLGVNGGTEGYSFYNLRLDIYIASLKILNIKMINQTFAS